MFVYSKFRKIKLFESINVAFFKESCVFSLFSYKEFLYQDSKNVKMQHCSEKK